jgi:hypothetical protein
MQPSKEGVFMKMLSILALVISATSVASPYIFTCHADGVDNLNAAAAVDITGAVESSTGVLKAPVLVIVNQTLIAEFVNPSAFYSDAASGALQLEGRKDVPYGASISLTYLGAGQATNSLLFSTAERRYKTPSFSCTFTPSSELSDLAAIKAL